MLQMSWKRECGFLRSKLRMKEQRVNERGSGAEICFLTFYVNRRNRNNFKMRNEEYVGQEY